MARLSAVLQSKYTKTSPSGLEAKSELLSIRSENDDADELLTLSYERLSDLNRTLDEIQDPERRFRFQKWLFPDGLIYDGEKFGTAKMPWIYRLKKNTQAGIHIHGFGL